MSTPLRSRSAAQPPPSGPRGPLTPSGTPAAAPRAETTHHEDHDADRAADAEREAIEQEAGESAFAAAADEGQAVEVTWADEFFQPVAYNGMHVGPFRATTIVRKGETIAGATLRLHRELAKAARLVFAEKSRAYLEHLAGITTAAANTRV